MKHFLMMAVTLLGLLSSCSQPEVQTLFVGTYSDGFYAFDFDVETGTVVPGEGEYGAVAKASVPNPSFLSICQDRVYAVSEMPDSRACVGAWRYGGSSFTFLGGQPTGLPRGGEDPCYVSTDGKLLAVANYSGGSLAVYSLQADGRIAPLDSLVFSGIGGPDLVRQNQPHVHCALFTKGGKLLFSEFSADAIGSLDVTFLGVDNYRVAARLPADFGPRHLLLNAEESRLYCIGELSGDVAVFSYPALELLQLARADEVDARGAADIHLSPDGRYLYASLRLQNDGLAIFRVEEDGTLHKTAYQPSGPHPRHFTVLENWVLVACRDSGEIEIYARDKKTGSLQDTGRRIAVPKPVFVSVSSL